MWRSSTHNTFIVWPHYLAKQHYYILSLLVCLLDIIWYQLLLFVFDLCSHPICWVWSDFTACLLAHLACMCLAKLWSTERPRKVPLARVVWNLLAAADFRRVRFEELLAERFLSSYCWVVSFLCFDTLWNFSASLPRNGNVVVQRRTSLRVCRVVVNVVAHRSTSSRGVLHRRGRWYSSRTISSSITGNFVKRQRKRPGRTVSSDRVVPFHLISVAERGHAVRTVRRVTSYRLSSKSECVDPRRKIVSRR